MNLTGIKPFHQEAAGEIYQGNCLDIMPFIPGKSIDMILCDLPYGTTACSWDTVIPFEPLWKEYKRVIKDNGAIVLTASQPFTSALVMSNIKMFKYCWHWYKNNPVGFQYAKTQPMRAIEDIPVFYMQKPPYHPQMMKSRISDRKVKNGMKNGRDWRGTSDHHSMKVKAHPLNEDVWPWNVLEIPVVPRATGTLHPTQKPVALFEYLIRTYTNEGDLVLDNCLGSGTTAVAAKNLGRRFLGIELSPEYCAVAVKRLSQGVLNFGKTLPAEVVNA